MRRHLGLRRSWPGVVLTATACAGAFLWRRLAREAAPTLASEVRYANALVLYRSGQVAEAHAAALPLDQEFLRQEHGCDLALSLLAQRHEFAQLGETARQCLHLELGHETAFDAIAAAAYELDQAETGIAELEQWSKSCAEWSRLWFAKSRLHFMLGQLDAGRRDYLQGFTAAKIWSMWLTYAIRHPYLGSDFDFWQRMIPLLNDRHPATPGLARRLTAHLSTLQLRPPPHWDQASRLTLNSETGGGKPIAG